MYYFVFSEQLRFIPPAHVEIENLTWSRTQSQEETSQLVSNPSQFSQHWDSRPASLGPQLGDLQCHVYLTGFVRVRRLRVELSFWSSSLTEIVLWSVPG